MNLAALPLLAFLYLLSLTLLAIALREAQRSRSPIAPAVGGFALQALLGFMLYQL